MAKELSWNGVAESLSKTDVDSIVTNVDSWFDPDNGHIVDFLYIRYDGIDDAGNTVFSIDLYMTRTGVPSSNVSTVMNTLATTINNIDSRFGTVSEIEDAMMMRE